MSDLLTEINKRRTFAIISHPDAGKTTLTEKLLLLSGAIQLAGTVKGRKSMRHATSDWMALEKERGISVTTSVMQFPYREGLVNLLDTPGHADFTEDTYRTLTAVDSALMIIDAGKGVEPRTIKLMQVCRLRTTPIMTFINKMDRDTRMPIELLDEIESVLDISCAPVTWPIGMGQHFKGIYHLIEDAAYIYHKSSGEQQSRMERVVGPKEIEIGLGRQVAEELRHDIDLIKGAGHPFDLDTYLSGALTPVFFGSAMNNIGVSELLDYFIRYAPKPQSRQTLDSVITAEEPDFSGFVFKIQANMDPAHRDRLAFLRIVSGHYEPGARLYHNRLNRSITLPHALTFMASKRQSTETAWPGDIIGIHNHGTLQIGDTLTTSKKCQFVGIPHFAPELFRTVQLKDPLKQKALLKGLTQLSEEGATQVFRPLSNNLMILGAVGSLQFDVVAYRLKHEYRVQCDYAPVSVVAVRWVRAEDPSVLRRFQEACHRYLAWDNGEHLVYLAPSLVNLNIAIEKWSNITFRDTREH